MTGTETDTKPVVPEWEPERQIMTPSEADDKGSFKTEGTIELRIDRFAEFVRDGTTRVSAPKYIRGLSWSIMTSPKDMCQRCLKDVSEESDDEDGQPRFKLLSIDICCHGDSANRRWECQAKFSLSVMAQKQGVEDIVEEDIERTFDGKDGITGINNGGWGHVISGNRDLLLDPENGYIKDDTVILQAHVKPLTLKAVSGALATKLYGQLFTSSTPFPWDFVLVIEDEEVHVQKSLLAIHSVYFKDQFANHEQDGRAILENVYYGEFIELLSVIYPTTGIIKAENVETISKLAFKFYMDALLTKCEIFLMENNREFGSAKALLLAEWYGLEHLTGAIITEIDDITDIKTMKPEYVFISLYSNRTKLMLFDRICSPAPISNPDPEPEDTDIATNRATNILQELTSSVCCASDGVLIVENNRIPIHKMHLAMNSEYFKALFQSEFAEKSKDEIVLEEVGYNDILELLQVIYPTASPITELNIEVILKMADRFVMPAILARCKKLLQSSTQIRLALKLWFAQRYNFPDLQAEYAKKYKTKSDVNKLRAEPEFGLFDAKTRVLILDSLVS